MGKSTIVNVYGSCGLWSFNWDYNVSEGDDFISRAVNDFQREAATCYMTADEVKEVESEGDTDFTKMGVMIQFISVTPLGTYHTDIKAHFRCLFPDMYADDWAELLNREKSQSEGELISWLYENKPIDSLNRGFHNWF